MQWQKTLHSRPELYWVTTHLNTWKALSITLAMLLNVIVAVCFPFDTKNYLIDGKAGLFLWISAVASTLAAAYTWYLHAHRKKLGKKPNIVTRHRLLALRLSLSTIAVRLVTLNRANLALNFFGLLQVGQSSSLFSCPLLRALPCCSGPGALKFVLIAFVYLLYSLGMPF